jgi:hypothetical protein
VSSALELFLERDRPRMRVGSEEWKKIVHAKVEALDTPGTVMEFSLEEAEEAGFVEDIAFDGIDLDAEAADAMAFLARQALTQDEREEMQRVALLEQLPAEEGESPEDAWLL